MSLVKSHQDSIVNTCFGFVRSEEDARDLAQEVFVEVFLSIRNFREDASLSTWIYRIAVNKSLDWLRRKNRKKRFAFWQGLGGLNTSEVHHISSSIETPSSLLVQKERRELLGKALEKLPENQRIAWTLHKIEEMSQADVAAIMNTSIPAVESLIHRAKKNLFAQLEKVMK
ncbi:MAG: RNA polymerase sigma factor [Bacteroidales bacterium]|nr:RNA polymerase sigma factor [Bacteroidales bacterium]